MITERGRAGDAGLDSVLTSDPPPFALLHRPESTDSDRLDLLIGTIGARRELAELRLPEPRDEAPSGAGRATHDLLVFVPYRQIIERGFACHDDKTPILAMTVKTQVTVSVQEALRRIPDAPVTIENARFDIDDEIYAALVRDVLMNEISTGEGSNFVIKRSFVADIAKFSSWTALAIFRRLLTSEQGAYCTFIVYTGSRAFVGASPEQHVHLAGGTLSMNPVSGTYRYPSSGPSLSGVLNFLGDRKETDELYMVVDEELKMMGRACEQGGRVSGPYLKEMGRLAHTEYVLRGRSSLNVLDAIRETMFAPTVIGSPLENACRVIGRYEPYGRGYYSGILALIGRDANDERVLDSSILIRTADIDRNGRLNFGVGATLVRHSDPETEVAETRAKTAGMRAALGVDNLLSVAPHSWSTPNKVTQKFAAHPEVRKALDLRNTTLARFWLDQPDSADQASSLAGRRVLVIDAEDTFTTMLGHQLRSLGLRVTTTRCDKAIEPEGFDLVIIGPGPGDPSNDHDPKIAKLQTIAARLINGDTPFLAVCLGHQVLSSVLGFKLLRRRRPNQGAQREIDLFGRVERVGFYNSFVAKADGDRAKCSVLSATVEISRDPETGEVHALRGPGFASVQFHPESVLTQNGIMILNSLLTQLIVAHACAN